MEPFITVNIDLSEAKKLNPTVPTIYRFEAVRTNLSPSSSSS